MRLRAYSPCHRMPPSQLKRLKTSLREQGITGPQKSNKQKKAAKGTKATADRIQRNAALQQVRDTFNPFELKAPSRPAKFQHANSNGVSKASRYKDVLHRPGVTKSAGEEMRRQKLLPEMQRRNKVGGLVDRRIGEGDPGMTAEERAVQRFAQEKQRRKGAGLFDLEGSDEDETKGGLTHGGMSLDDLGGDEFEEVKGGRGRESEDDGELMKRKRKRSYDEEDEESDVQDEGNEQGEPDRKRSRKEVMEEVIAKSKLHKYERQKAKEDDDDLREELDKDMDGMIAMLRGQKRPPPPKAAETQNNGDDFMMNPERQKLLDGADRAQVNREYDARLRKLAQDARAKPSERTKTEDEKVREEAERLKELEERRVKRMRGEQVSDEEQDGDRDVDANGDVDNLDEAAEFGFTNSNVHPKEGMEKEKVVLEDEDDFALDEDLIASDSEIDSSGESESEADSDMVNETRQDQDEEEDEFDREFLGDLRDTGIKVNGHTTTASEGKLAYTYPCPRTHEELLSVVKDAPVEQLPTIVQRIRALHHPSLSATNKEAMADFSTVLVEHLSYMGLQKQLLVVAEQIIRHLHSLSRTYSENIANAFRSRLRSAHERRDLHAGDLVILTAIDSIYPTSDHFHQVVTPAMTVMAKWLGMIVPDSCGEARHRRLPSGLYALSIKD